MIGVIGGLIGGMMQRSAAKNAAKAQERATDKQIDFAKETRDLTRSDLRSYHKTGVTAQNALASLYGLNVPDPAYNPAVTRYEITPEKQEMATRVSGGGRGEWKEQYLKTTPADYGWRVGDKTFADEASAQGYADEVAANSAKAAQGFKAPMAAPWEFEFGDFKESPGYGFRLNQGLEAVQGASAARHGLNSGATMTAMNDYAQGMASNEYSNWYGREMDRYNRGATQYYNYLNGLAGMANSGQNAAAGMGGANALASQQVIKAYGDKGNATAAGHIGAANALSDGIGNAVGAWQYNNLLNKGGKGGGFNSLFAV